MKKTKFLLAMLLVVTMTLSLCACNVDRDFGGDAVVDGEMYPDQSWDMLKLKREKPIEITMWIPNSATSTMGKGISELAEKFNAFEEEKHPGKNIKVTVEFQGTSGALNTKLQASILAGNNPVITAIGVSSVPQYGDRAVDLRTVFSYKELQAQQQGLLQYSLFNDKFMLNPYFPSASSILVVNKTMFEDKGVKIPEIKEILAGPEASNWNWDEFKKAAKAVSDPANGIYGFAAGAVDPAGMMYQQGSSLYNSTVTDIEFDKDDKFKKGLEFWRSLVTEELMVNPIGRANHNSIIISEFYEQKSAMISTTSSNLSKFTAEAKKAGFEIGVLPFPKQEKFFVNHGGSGIIILNNKPIEEQQGAAEFLRWLNQPEQIAEMCAASGYLPLDLRATEEEALKAVYSETPMLKDCSEMMMFGVKASQGKAKAAADKAVNNYAKEIWSELDKSIDDIYNEILEVVKYEIEANK